MANDFELRLKALEDREAILYRYIDELRKWALESRAEHEDSRKHFDLIDKRIEQNEWVISTVVETQRSMIETQNKILERQDFIFETLKRVLERQDSMFEAIKSILETQSKLIQTVNGLVETQGIMIKAIERIDQKVDSLINPGKNGHS
jgi:uncharacterized coiled-coil protein SlyX